MSDLTSPTSSTNGAAPPSLWQRVTLKQVALATTIVVLIALGLALVVVLRYVFLMLFLGIVVATALAPVVERLRKFGLSQSAAALTAFGLLLLLIGGILAALMPFFAAQIAQAAQDLPN
jgi:predicted PurR-regulated permease PerM